MVALAMSPDSWIMAGVNMDLCGWGVDNPEGDQEPVLAAIISAAISKQRFRSRNQRRRVIAPAITALMAIFSLALPPRYQLRYQVLGPVSLFR
jgi:hypothetical protein